MSYIEHAKREFLALGYKPIDQEEDGPNKWIQESIFELLEVLSKQGHSGGSIGYAVDVFSKLALFQPLCPLTGADDEWNEVEPGNWQNIRCSHVFKNEVGVAYDIDGYVFWHWSERPLDPDEEGFPGTQRYKSYFGSSHSRKLVSFPYMPQEPTPIEVVCVEVNEETDEPEPGSGWWKTTYPAGIEENHSAVRKALEAVEMTSSQPQQ